MEVAMRAWIIVVLMVLAGIVGAWVGYWIGHFAGWSENAVWPLTIGGGTGAIVLSIALSFLSVWAVGLWLIARPLLRNRRLLTTGIKGHATILKVWRTGVSIKRLTGNRRQVGVELEMHPANHTPYRTQTTYLADPAEEGKLHPGTEVDVRFDPSQPRSVAIEGLQAAPTA
jgi:hypothetical protein